MFLLYNTVQWKFNTVFMQDSTLNYYFEYMHYVNANIFLDLSL